MLNVRFHFIIHASLSVDYNASIQPEVVLSFKLKPICLPVASLVKQVLGVLRLTT